jgi:hypothetical protein
LRASLDSQCDVVPFGVSVIGCCRPCTFRGDVLSELVGTDDCGKEIPGRQSSVGLQVVVTADMLEIRARVQAVVQE